MKRERRKMTKTKTHSITLFYIHLLFVRLLLKWQKSKQNCKVIKKDNKKDCDTRCSRVISNPSTNRARRGLTSLIGREVVFSSWYGRNQLWSFNNFLTLLS